MLYHGLVNAFQYEIINYFLFYFQNSPDAKWILKMSIVYLLHHSISSAIFCVIILTYVSSIPPPTIPNLISYANRNHPSHMQRVVVFNSTRDVYVGARNTLYYFTSDLRVKGIVSTGPELDHHQCLHPRYPCVHNRTLTDNDNKVLQIFSRPNATDAPFLVTCGTLYQGLCHLAKLNDISKRTWIKPFDEKVGFVSGRGSTVAFFAQGYNKQMSLYSASTYDGRPLEYSPASVSSKVITVQNGSFSFKYSDKNPGISFTGVNFDSKFKDNYKVCCDLCINCFISLLSLLLFTLLLFIQNFSSISPSTVSKNGFKLVNKRL